jgi:NADH-ubiquinone oxidoreductase chain 5
MFSFVVTCGNLDFATVFSLSPYFNSNISIIVGIGLLIGAMAKSSQIGLHAWLPQAICLVIRFVVNGL